MHINDCSLQCFSIFPNEVLQVAGTWREKNEG